MARFKQIDTSPQFVAIDLHAQLIPSTFAFALNYLVEEELDLSALHLAYCNSDSGAPAYPPSILLKVILLGYAHGFVSSRAIARACREQAALLPAIHNVLPWMAPTTLITADSGYHSDRNITDLEEQGINVMRS
jgi:hypothetical protein